MRSLLAVATVAIVVLGASLFFPTSDAERPIATITGLSGSLQWTGDGGRVSSDLSVGTGLLGGTIEGMGPESWFELEFNDRSTVTISGNSMLILSDDGQKVLHLKEGILSANVEPQPADKPMPHLHAVRRPQGCGGRNLRSRWSLGRPYSMSAREWWRSSVSLAVNRLMSPRTIVWSPRPIAICRRSGSPTRVSRWKSHLQRGPRGTHGEWLAATGEQAARLRGVPFVPPDFPSDTLYMLGAFRVTG